MSIFVLLLAAVLLENKEKKATKSEKGNDRLDLPIGDDIENAVSRRRVDENDAESVKSYKTQNTNSRTSGKKSRRT